MTKTTIEGFDKGAGGHSKPHQNPRESVLASQTYGKSTLSIFFHGDADGCCSAALILMALKMPAKLVPILEPSDLERKTRRHSGNAIFLDLGTVTGKIVGRFSNAIVIDHHPGARLPCVHINPALDGKRTYPASYLVYGLFGGPKWIAMAGCVGDWFLPRGVRGPIEKAYYKSKYGKIARAIDSTCAVLGERGAIHSVKSLLAGKVSEKMRKCLSIVEGGVEKAIAAGTRSDGRLISLLFSSRYGIKSQVAQLLKVRHKRRVIFIGQLEGKRVKFSIREGADYLDLNRSLKTCLKGLNGGGGGHARAVGGWVDKKDFDRLLERLEKIVNCSTRTKAR